MKISMIVLNPFIHDTRVRKEAESLMRQGHLITVNALWKPGLAIHEDYAGISIFRFRQYARELIHIPGLAWLELLLTIPFKVVSQHPEIIHAHDLNALILAYPAARLSQAHIIYDAHELESERNFSGSNLPGWRKRLVIAIESFLIHRVNATITVSPSIAKHLQKLYQIPEPFIVRNCPQVVEIPLKGRLRSLIGLAAGKPLVLYQGGVLAGRGLPALLEAIALLPEVTLVILGDGPVMGSTKEQAQEMGIQDRVHFLGAVPNQELLTYTCDATLGTCLIDPFCLSYFYSLPNKLFEYMMVGVPVLASNFPDLQQVILDARAGEVIDPENPPQIALAIKNLLDDPIALTELSTNARASALARYNWQLEEQTLFKAYQTALKKNL